MATALTKDDFIKLATDRVKAVRPNADITRTDITEGFLGLVLASIWFQSGTESPHYYYLFYVNGLMEGEYRTSEDLFQAIKKLRQPSFWDNPLATTLINVPGVIAILVVLTICSMLIFQGRTDVPQVLSGALTLILGFYFGSATSKSKDK